MNWVFLLWMALSLWPLIVVSVILTLFLLSMLAHVPAIYERHGSRTRWFLALGILLILEAVGTVLVMRSPFSRWPTSLEIAPIATVGLLLSAWALFAWVMATELTARMEYQRQEKGESVDDVLGSWEPSPNGKTTTPAGVR